MYSNINDEKILIDKFVGKTMEPTQACVKVA